MVSPPLLCLSRDNHPGPRPASRRLGTCMSSSSSISLEPLSAHSLPSHIHTFAYAFPARRAAILPPFRLLPSPYSCSPPQGTWHRLRRCLAWPLLQDVFVVFPWDIQAALYPPVPVTIPQAQEQGHISLFLSFRERKASLGPLESWDLQDARYVQEVGQRLLVPLAFLAPDCLSDPGLA